MIYNKMEGDFRITKIVFSDSWSIWVNLKTLPNI